MMKRKLAKHVPEQARQEKVLEPGLGVDALNVQ